MKKKLIVFIALSLCLTMLFGCGEKKENGVAVASDSEFTAEEIKNGTLKQPTSDSVSDYTNPIISQMLSDAGLSELSNDVTVRPIGSLYSVGSTADFENGVATFTYTEGENVFRYIVDLNREKVQRGEIEVLTQRNDGEQVLAVTDAGLTYLAKNGKKLNVKKFGEASAVEMSANFDRENGHLILDYVDSYDGVNNQKRYDFFIKGKSLVVQVTSPSVNGENGYASFTTGMAKNLTDARTTSLMYAEEVNITVLNENYFVSAYLDRAKSFSTKVSTAASGSKTTVTHGMSAEYEINSKGETNPVHELFYITAADDVMDCVYRSNAERSEYCDKLNDLVVYDQWAFANTYSARKYSMLKLYEDYGLNDMLYVEHRWQRDTLDQSNPIFYPASKHWGSEAEWNSYLETIRDKIGWLVALHEDYWFITPSEENHYWNEEGVEKTIAQTADGELRLGWQDWTYANLSSMMSKYSSYESQLIKDNYKTEACFTDVSGGVDASLLNMVTMNADEPTSRTIAQVTADTVDLFKTLRNIYQGPVVSEGGQGGRSVNSIYAGWLDSSSREITDCHDCRIMPDYELTHVRTRMANEGMGPPGRFQADIDDVFEIDFDRYNAVSIAYGHTGFIGDYHYSTPLFENEIVRTYYMFRALQPQYLDSSVKVDEITYFDLDGNSYDLNAAILADYDFYHPRLHIVYSNGLELYMNFIKDVWTVELGGAEYELDKNGYVISNESLNFLEYSCLKDGHRVDYVKCDDYFYCDPRGTQTDFGDGTVTGSSIIRYPDGFEASVAARIEEGDIQFTDLVTDTNGDNGFTYYYTDGTTLTPFSEFDDVEGKWVHGNEGVLIYPALTKSDNYGVAGSSASEYVVLGYQIPESGKIRISCWTVLQGPAGKHGYNVKVALGTPDNIVGGYELTGDTQKADIQNYDVDVEEGQEIFIIYEPIVKRANEWFGFINSVTYLEREEA